MGATPESVAQLFTRADGSYLCARWGRPLVPVVFGVDEPTLAIVKGACEAIVALAGHKMAETDPEIGANFMLFFIRDWSELRDVPGLDRLIPDLNALLDRLEGAGANQYRIFRFDADDAIKACFAFVVMDDDMSSVPAETLALTQIVQAVLLWSDVAFTNTSPLARAGDTTILRPDIAAVIRAAYDPVLPGATTDSGHAYRLAARLTRGS
ncbi:hypothetical protein [Actibacterium sp. 188UL27-1]|uniref:hypothetical protein n=1 Tax=Actibacterium sp. 188UL27-1 TaxID=2786961 RepID=UPI001957A367|nr:hypothetical protein [Actibacterium sp. 188UL27-1]MBM7066562.1 hypothetical protein [Actibacterium sp. 188UL27-1]